MNSLAKYLLNEDKEVTSSGIRNDFETAMSIMEDKIPRPMIGHRFEIQIQPGFYNLSHPLAEDRVPIPEQFLSDDIFVFRSEASKQLREEIASFWDSRDHFERLGFLHKRGIIVYGRPGSGKSSLLKMEAENLVKQNQIVFISHSPYTLCESIKTFRKKEPERDLTVILEDVDEITSSWGEQVILEMLDGMDTANHVLFIGTTNNLDRLSPKLRRPGRFDRKIEVPNPDKNVRLEYLKIKFGNLKEQKLRKIAELTEGLSFGHLRELVVSVEGYGVPLNKTIERLRREDIVNSSDRFSKEKPSYPSGD